MHCGCRHGVTGAWGGEGGSCVRGIPVGSRGGRDEAEPIKMVIFSLSIVDSSSACGSE